ncbi:hypothetical protein PQR08_23560 [Caballeronia jiangsuensis]|uniref:Uncharacterized protein n=1 Tax=Caballeronia jiangsuensis TaxID=1458357 RepID=A0ABW9CPA8_9BURK
MGVISISDLEGGASQRRPFEVIFYKEILDHVGLPHHNELLSVSIAHGTKQEAVASAIVQFEATKRVASWTAIADGYDVLSIRVNETGKSIESLEHTFDIGTGRTRNAQCRSLREMR